MTRSNSSASTGRAVAPGKAGLVLLALSIIPFVVALIDRERFAVIAGVGGLVAICGLILLMIQTPTSSD